MLCARRMLSNGRILHRETSTKIYPLVDLWNDRDGHRLRPADNIRQRPHQRGQIHRNGFGMLDLSPVVLPLSQPTQFILLSPCLFLATNYMILSHLARIFPQEVVERSLIVRQSRIVKIFVWSDVTTFLLQSSGGGLTAMKNVNLANIGNKVCRVVLSSIALVDARFRSPKQVSSCRLSLTCSSPSPS